MGTSGDAESGSSTGFILVCIPGETVCSGDPNFREVCAPTGLEWVPEPCGSNRQCSQQEDEDGAITAECLGPCDVDPDSVLPTSAGCSFIANRQLHVRPDLPDSVIVANPNVEETANVHLWATPEGKNKEELLEGPIMLAPGEFHQFDIETEFILSTVTQFRTGGTFRVASDVPVIAYQHAPFLRRNGNSSALLLPDSTLRRDYVIASYNEFLSTSPNFGTPSYFVVIALHDETDVEWTPFSTPTGGNGLPIETVMPGDTGTQRMNRFDTMRITSSPNFNIDDPDERDVSGTVVTASQPIWVVGASKCSSVPHLDPVEDKPPRCDPMQEIMIPIAAWGTTYVVPAPPTRERAQNDHWRIYNARSGTNKIRFTPANVTTECAELDGRGDYCEIRVEPGRDFVVEGVDGPIMPVGYLESTQHPTLDVQPPEWASLGDASMYQLVPVEQYLSRYVFVTALVYDFNYVQVLRPSGAPSISLTNNETGMQIDVDSSFTPIGPGDHEVATVLLPQEGAYTIESDGPFGIIQMGWTEPSPNCPWIVEEPRTLGRCFSSYAYPGGFKLEEISVP